MSLMSLIGKQTITLKNLNFKKLSEGFGFKDYTFAYKKKN